MLVCMKSVEGALIGFIFEDGALPVGLIFLEGALVKGLIPLKEDFSLMI